MLTEIDKASERGAVGPQASVWRWLFGFGLCLVPLNLLASAGLLPSSPAASQRAPTSEATATADQEKKLGIAGDLATIIQSGSTNTVAYNLVIHSDGSATAMPSNSTQALGAKREYPPGTIDANKLRRLLTEIGDVSRIPIGICMRSSSFGTTTRISYAGKLSGDLQCIQHQASGGDEALLHASEDLAAFVRTIRSQVKLDTQRRASPNP
ncbi:MAG: hypothetical protein ABSC64_10240 [Candidatus Korobacteraceae bacterium]